MATDINRDERARQGRDHGQPFVELARILEVESAREATAAFNRALRGRPNAEQAWLRRREVARLDASASRLRWRDDLSVQEIVRGLRSLQHQRKMLLVA
jgi:hypothetical protein